MSIPLVGFAPISPGILKKTLSSTSSTTVKRNSTVTIEYSIYSIHGTNLAVIDSSLHRKSPLKVDLGCGMILKSLESAILSMTQGEKAQFYVQGLDLVTKEYFEQSNQSADLTKQYRLDIEVKAIHTPFIPFETLIKAAESRKQEANELYKVSKHLEAIELYKEAVITSSWGYTETEGAEILNVNFTLYSNMAAAATKLCKWDLVLENCKKALEIKSDPKVLFRLAKAYTGLHLYEQAMDIVQNQAEKNPTDELWRNEAKIIKGKIKTTSKNEKSLYGKMFV